MQEFVSFESSIYTRLVSAGDCSFYLFQNCSIFASYLPTPIHVYSFILHFRSMLLSIEDSWLGWGNMPIQVSVGPDSWLWEYQTSVYVIW